MVSVAYKSHFPCMCYCFVLYCSMLATKLNMSRDDAEKWIVNLIRNAKLDAKIDAKEVIE